MVLAGSNSDEAQPRVAMSLSSFANRRVVSNEARYSAMAIEELHLLVAHMMQCWSGDLDSVLVHHSACFRWQYGAGFHA